MQGAAFQQFVVKVQEKAEETKILRGEIDELKSEGGVLARTKDVIFFFHSLRL